MIVTYLFVFNEYKIFCLISLIEEMNTIIIRTNKQTKKRNEIRAHHLWERKKERMNIQSKIIIAWEIEIENEKRKFSIYANIAY